MSRTESNGYQSESSLSFSFLQLSIPLLSAFPFLPASRLPAFNLLALEAEPASNISASYLLPCSFLLPLCLTSLLVSPSPFRCALGPPSTHWPSCIAVRVLNHYTWISPGLKILLTTEFSPPFLQKSLNGATISIRIFQPSAPSRSCHTSESLCLLLRTVKQRSVQKIGRRADCRGQLPALPSSHTAKNRSHQPCPDGSMQIGPWCWWYGCTAQCLTNDEGLVGR